MEVFVLLKNLMSLSPTPPPPCQESLLGHLKRPLKMHCFKNYYLEMVFFQTEFTIDSALYVYYNGYMQH